MVEGGRKGDKQKKKKKLRRNVEHNKKGRLLFFSLLSLIAPYTGLGCRQVGAA